ncbi:hypothetical protein IFM89_035644 [Coptis chinensis]|uniref:Pentatricopeptide repeat-containing protein n=1 Tax=Coptis chinensis TaxID=261450 RepID=A0A835LLC6_9MAGN|nr:hypothetical protein IFM89_035644 [Coptis chinensis]
MFTSISRLSRVFPKNTRITITATPQILTKTQTPKQEEKPEEINKLSKQKNLTTLVENEIGRFRSPHLAYEKTIARQQQVLEHHQNKNKFDDITKQGFAMRLISLYGKPGMFDHALKLFDELPERTVKTYNALLNANASVVSNKFDETHKLFREPSLKKLSDFPSEWYCSDWFTFLRHSFPVFVRKGSLVLLLSFVKRVLALIVMFPWRVQVVVDGLVKGSKVEEAKGLMEIAQSKKCYRSKLSDVILPLVI